MELSWGATSFIWMSAQEGNLTDASNQIRNEPNGLERIRIVLFWQTPVPPPPLFMYYHPHSPPRRPRRLLHPLRPLHPRAAATVPCHRAHRSQRGRRGSASACCEHSQRHHPPQVSGTGRRSPGTPPHGEPSRPAYSRDSAPRAPPAARAPALRFPHPFPMIHLAVHGFGDRPKGVQSSTLRRRGAPRRSRGGPDDPSWGLAR